MEKLNRKQIWNRISWFLMFTDETNKKKTDIQFYPTGEFGISSNDTAVINWMWQHPTEGIISYTIEGSDEVFDLSEMDKNELLQVYNWLEEDKQKYS